MLNAVKDWRFLALSMSLCVLYGGLLIPFYFIVTFATDKGMDSRMAHNLLSVTYAGSFCGRIGSGWLASRFGV